MTLLLLSLLAAGTEYFHAEATVASFSPKVNSVSHQLRNLLAAITSDQSCFESDLDGVARCVSSTIDSLLARVDLHLDEHHRPTKREFKSPGAVFHAHDIAKPQDSFADTIDNSTNTFIPPVPISMGHDNDDCLVRQQNRTHPLEQTIVSLDCSSQRMLQPKERTNEACMLQHGVDSTPLEMIETEDALQLAAEELSQHDEVAFDLEANQYRSFHGLTCLIQASSRNKDYIVDALKLRSSIRSWLGPLFENPNILKVLHGADLDITWLQRDFGCYIVNLFDTGQAARAFGFERVGLGALLKHFCNVQLDKRLQLADWRIRPLTSAMLTYARADTHYLLSIKDRLVTLLSSVNISGKNGVQYAFEQSQKVSLNLFQREGFSESDFWDFYDKNVQALGELSPPQLAVFASLFAWRDAKARELDESKGYVLPKTALWRLSKRMPDGPQELLTVARGEVPVVQKRAREVADLVANSRAKGKPPARPMRGPGSKNYKTSQHGQSQQLHQSNFHSHSVAHALQETRQREVEQEGNVQSCSHNGGEKLGSTDQEEDARSHQTSDAVTDDTTSCLNKTSVRMQPGSHSGAFDMAAAGIQPSRKKRKRAAQKFQQMMEAKLATVPQPGHIGWSQAVNQNEVGDEAAGENTTDKCHMQVSQSESAAASLIVQHAEENTNAAAAAAWEGNHEEVHQTSRDFIPLDRRSRIAGDNVSTPALSLSDGADNGALEKMPPPLSERHEDGKKQKKKKRSPKAALQRQVPVRPFDFTAAKSEYEMSAVALQGAHSATQQENGNHRGVSQNKGKKQLKGQQNEGPMDIKRAAFKPARDKPKALIRSGNRSKTDPL